MQKTFTPMAQEKELEKIVLKPMEVLPSQSSDVYAPKQQKLVATISTLRNEREQSGKEHVEPHMTLSEEDKIWDIIIDTPEINGEVIREAIKALSEKTGISYVVDLN